MKVKSRISTIFFASVVCCGITISSYAADNSAEVRVEAVVDPVISVAALAPNSHIGTITQGDIPGEIAFRIEGNNASISVQALVTDLYKSGDPSLGEFIPVNTSLGATFTPQAAKVINGSELNVQYTSTEDYSKPEGTFVAHKTGAVQLEALEGDMFQQDLSVSATWSQDDPVKATGSYVGYVTLYVSAIGSES